MSRVETSFSPLVNPVRVSNTDCHWGLFRPLSPSVAPQHMASSQDWSVHTSLPCLLLYSIVSTMLNIGSLNCNGLRDCQKIGLLQMFIERERVNIAFLQKTHIDSLKLGNEIATKLNGRIIWSFSHLRGKGVGVFLSNSLRIDIHSFKADPLGRYVILDIELDSTPLRLINVYAPNIPAERKEFY